VLLETLPAEDGLRLTVADRPAPALRMLVSADRRLLLRQGPEPVLLARVAPALAGVDLVRTGRYRSPIPPLRAGQARRLAGPRGVLRWTYRFAELLTAAPLGPLHDGSWLLRAAPLPPYVLGDDLVREWPDASVDWFGSGWNGTIPLRRLDSPDAARVKAYRRQLVEGHLPPVLLWRISAFDGYVVLDGHDRLAAALAEGVEPPVLVLDRAAHNDDRDAWLAAAAARYEHAIAQITEQGAAAGLARSFGRETERISTAYGLTRAWQLPAAEWNDIAAREAPGWP
jgi:hypothetical protein